MNWKFGFKSKIVNTSLVALPMAFGTVGLTAVAHAQSTQPQPDPNAFKDIFVDEEPTFTTEAYVATDFSVAKNKSGKMHDSLKTANSFITFTEKFGEHIRGKLTLKLDKMFRENGQWADLDFNAGEFVEEAAIIISYDENKPVAFIIGKQLMPFGGDYSEMPANYNSPFYEALRQKDVIGFRVDIEDLFGLDIARFAVFETGENDFDIGTFDGVSMFLGKNLSSNVLLEGSAMYKGNDGTGLKHENRATVGLLYQNDATKIKAWAELLYLQNHPDLKTGGGFTGGMMFPAGKHGSVVAEVNYLYDSFLQLGVGYKLQITPRVGVGLEVRYTFADDKSALAEGLSFGGNVEYYFGPSPLNDRPIFDGSASDTTVDKTASQNKNLADGLHSLAEKVKDKQ